MTVVTMRAAKATLSKLIERAQLGEEIVIARGRHPAVKLTPIKQPVKREFGLYRGIDNVGPEFFEPLPEEELRAWEGEQNR